MDFRTWLLFIPAAIAISLSPGAAAVASMSSGASYGVRRSYLTIIGLEIALMLQLTLVAIGLGALLAASEVAFSVVKWCGVLYLAYLGIRLWGKTTWTNSYRGAPGERRSWCGVVGSRFAGKRLESEGRCFFPGSDTSVH
jgi:threonine/homoserine/homoserine lactone efflux protein